ASLSTGGRHAGRGGTGAVMGAKQLKAVAVRGHKQAEPARPGEVRRAAKDLSARSFGPATEKYRELGTVANLLVFNRLAVLPTRNFQQSRFAGAAALSGEQLGGLRGAARASCAACTIGCEHIYGVRRDGKAQNVRMEYETLFALGPLCGVEDSSTVLKAAALCDELGMDTISAGATIAFAMECVEKNLLDPENPPPLPSIRGKRSRKNEEAGMSPVGTRTVSVSTMAEERAQPAALSFGNGAAVLDLLVRMANRDGLGDLLAEGSRRAARAIGGGAANFAPHVKGLEMPGYEPRGLQAMALGLAVGARGADHNRSSAYEVDFSEGSDRMEGNVKTARRAVETEDRAALMDSLILCKFLRGVFHDFYTEAAKLLAAVTGWDLTAAELRQTSRRIVTARKWFNEREGWTPAEDTLPRRFLHEKLEEGPSAGAVLSPARLSSMIAAYNSTRGFTPDGHVPLTLRKAMNIL
ncbi:MAG: aldehyde ferredoxin oxidoreductase C-terminal domain-containing protein, partial [Acidobacteriota bacterium]